MQSLTLSATWTSGTINLVAYRYISEVAIPGAFMRGEVDVLTGGRPTLYDGTVPWLVFVPNTTTATNVQGVYQETQG